MSDITTEFRNYLVAQGLVRKALTAGAAPPMYAEPENGVPAPNEGANAGVSLTLGVFRMGGPAMPAYESFLRRDILEVWIRAQVGAQPSAVIAAWALEAQLRTALVDKRDWQMAGTHILESVEWRTMQRVSSDSQAYNFNMAYLFWRQASS
jgi:hypothetical protein